MAGSQYIFFILCELAFNRINLNSEIYYNEFFFNYVDCLLFLTDTYCKNTLTVIKKHLWCFMN